MCQIKYLNTTAVSFRFRHVCRSSIKLVGSHIYIYIYTYIYIYIYSYPNICNMFCDSSTIHKRCGRNVTMAHALKCERDRKVVVEQEAKNMLPAFAPTNMFQVFEPTNMFWVCAPSDNKIIYYMM